MYDRMENLKYVHFGIVVVVVGLIAFGMSLREVGLDKLLAGSGVKVTGLVLARDSEVDYTDKGQRQYTYTLGVEYYAGQRRLVGHFPVSQEAYRSHPANSHAVVYYDPENPSTARIDEALQPIGSMTVLYIGVGVVLAGIGLCLYGLKADRDARNAAPDLDEALAQAKRNQLR